MSEIHANILDHLKTELHRTVCRQKAQRKAHTDLTNQLRQLSREMGDAGGEASSLRKLLRQADPDNAEKYAEPEGQKDLDRRAAHFAGMRELLDFLAVNPDIPIGYSLAEISLYGHQGNPVDDEAEVDRIAAIMGETASRPHPSDHYRARKSFGPGGCVTLEAVSTKGSALKWELGDPMPTGVPAPKVAMYAMQWHGAHPDEPTCPYSGSCDSCFSSDEPVPAPVEREHLSSQLLHEASGADDEPPGGDADVELLDAEQETFARESAAAVEPEPQIRLAPFEPPAQCTAIRRVGTEEYRCTRDEGHWESFQALEEPELVDHFNPTGGAWPAFEAVER